MSLITEIQAHLPDDPKKDFAADKLLRRVVEESGWQPIETAPKDIDAILLYSPEESYVGHWSGTKWESVMSNAWCSDVTHWQRVDGACQYSDHRLTGER